MQSYIWVLTPDMSDIDPEVMDQYSCYDDRCLITIYYIDYISDFLDDNEIPFRYNKMNSEFEWKLTLEISDKQVISKLVRFRTGRYTTSALYPICKYKLYQCYVMPDCEPEYLQTFESVDEIYAHVRSLLEYPDIDKTKFIGWPKENTNAVYKFIEERDDTDDENDVFIPVASIYDGNMMVNMLVLPELD